MVGTDGARSEQPVLRVGSFSAFTSDAFLRYDADAGELLVPPRQPSGKGLIEDYLKSSDATATLPVDPSRGTLLAQLQRQPDLWDRVKQGGLVGGVITVLGAIGLLLAIWRMVYLGGIGRKVGSQMRELNHPRDDNPLGRIIGVLGPAAAVGPGDAGALLDEAILQETPPLERGQPLLAARRRGAAARPAGYRDRHDHHLPAITQSGAAIRD